MDWISSIKISSPRNLAKEGRTPSTGKWLLDRIEYRDWKRSCGFLWLYGVG
jgi:hypothetical protein